MDLQQNLALKVYICSPRDVQNSLTVVSYSETDWLVGLTGWVFRRGPVVLAPQIAPDVKIIGQQALFRQDLNRNVDSQRSNDDDDDDDDDDDVEQ